MKISKTIVRRLAISTLTLVSCICLRAQDSPTFRNDLTHSGVYSTGVPEFHHVKWTFHTQDEVVSSPAVVGNVVYVGSNDGSLYAIDRETGAQQWKFATESRIPSSPAVANGVVYVNSYDGHFYAVDATTGKLRWKFDNPGERRFAAPHLHGTVPAGETMPDPFDVYLSSPAVWNGSVYFGSGDGNIYALDATTGTLRWKFHTGDVVHASPAIADGKLYIGSWDSYFYALDVNNGKLLWRFKTGEDPDIHNQVGIQSSATIANGTVYFGCRDSNLYALDTATGKLRWSYNNKGSWVITSPIVHDGKVYFATSDTALLLSVDAQSGKLIDSTKLLWPIFSSPAIAGETLYVASQDGKLIAVSLTSKKIAWTFQSEGSKKNLAALSKPDGHPNYAVAFTSNFYDDLLAGFARTHTVGNFVSSPVISGDILLIGSADGNLYALE